jgi:hypothetical protein
MIPQLTTSRSPVDTLDFVKVTEAAALAASRWMGRAKAMGYGDLDRVLGLDDHERREHRLRGHRHHRRRPRVRGPV